jgi:hypothetical protein
VKRIVVIAVVLGALLASSATASPPPWQKHALRVVPGKTTHWASNEKFLPAWPVESATYVDGHELHGVYGCSDAESGHGAVVIINLCGDRRATMRVKAVALDGRPHRVTVIWRVRHQFYAD